MSRKASGEASREASVVWAKIVAYRVDSVTKSVQLSRSLHGYKDIDEKEDEFKIIICPRCTIKNDPGAKFCSGCSLGLDEKSIIEYDQRKEEAAKLGFDLISADTRTQDMINQTLLDQIKILTKEIQELKKK